MAGRRRGPPRNHRIRVCPNFHDFDRALSTADGGWSNAEGLEQVRCLAPIAMGSKDRVLTPHQARYFLDRIPDARRVELHGLGHVPMSDDPVLIARTILDFTADGRVTEPRITA